MAIDFSKYKMATTPTTGSSSGGIDFSQYKLSDLPAKPNNQGGLSTDITGGVLPGAEKGAVSTLGGLSDAGGWLARNTVGRVTNYVQGKGFTAPQVTSPINGVGNPLTDKSIIDPSQPVLAPQGTGENLGYYGEKVGEFITPAGIEGKAISASDKIIEGMNLVDKLGSVVGKGAMTALKGTARALTGLSSGTAVGTAQTGDPKKGLETGVVNAIASPLVEGIVGVFPKAAQILQKISMRLTPAVKRDFANKLTGITNYLLKNNVIGTAAQQSEKLDGIFTKTENTLQSFFDKNAKDRFVSKSQLKTSLDQAKESVARDNPDAASAIKQIDDAKSNLDFQYGKDEIPLARLNELKRGTFKGAFNKAGSKVLGEVEYAIGDVYKTAIEGASKGLKVAGKDIGDFNEDYGNLINARKFLAASESKNGGLLEKVFSSIISGGLGSVLGPFGTSIGAVAGPLVEKPVVDAGTSILGNILNKAAGPTASGILKQTPKLGLPFVAK